VRVIVMAQALRHLTVSEPVGPALRRLAAWEREAETLITRLHSCLAARSAAT
jgi:hypothetical protein